MRKATTLVLTLTLALALTAPGLAADKASWDQEHESRVLSDRFWGTAGGFLVSNTTNASVGIGGVIGTTISMENTLGLQADEDTFRSDGFWRFTPKHSLGWTLFSFRRDGTAIITEEIVFEDITISAGAVAESSFTTSLLGINYRFSFINTGKVETGIVVGLNAYNFDVGIRGVGEYDDGSGPTTGEFEGDASIIAPVPSAGMFVNYAFYKGFLLRLKAQFFDLDYKDYSGRMIDTTVLVEFYPWKHVGFGFGVNAVDLKYVDDAEPRYEVRYDFSGALLYVSFRGKRILPTRAKVN